MYQLKLPHLSYRAQRALRICTVFTITVAIQEILRVPHAGWIGFAVIMIYAGFDNGTTLFRAFHRFWGMLLGLLSGYVLWFIGHLDYRTLIIIIPLTIFFAYYLAGHAYSIPTAFTVNTAVIGTGYFYAHNNYSITFFIVDYALCTIIGFAIILVLEYFWFRRHRLMTRFIEDTQLEIFKRLQALVELVNQETIRHSEFFRRCMALNSNLTEVNNLVASSKFLLSSEEAVGDEFNRFIELSARIFVSIKALYSAYYTKRYHKHDYYQLYQQVQNDLQELGQLLAIPQQLSIQSGAIHEAHN